MDLGDPRESLVSLDDHATWEADNRVEERWQWGAQILDLCNLSPEDYKNSTAVTVKTIQDCGECGGGGGGSTVSDNKGEASVSDGTFTVSFESPTASKVYVFVTIKDGNGDEYTFTVPVAKGSDTATYDISKLTTSSPYSITDVKVGLNSDGSDAADSVKDSKYEYSVTYENTKKGGKAYVFSILCTEAENLTPEGFYNIIQAQGEGFDYVASYDEISFEDSDTAEAVFYAPCSYVDQWMTEPQEEEYFETHSYDFIVLTQDTVVEIKEDFTTDTENWEADSITMNGKKYAKWTRRDLSGAQCPYAIGEDECEDYELPYTFKISE